MLIACERGQSYAFDPAHTALLCIDYQTDFLSNVGMAAQRGLPVQNLQRVLGPASSVLRAAREMGIEVIHLRECYAPDLSDLNAFRKARDTIVGAPGPLGRFLIKGEAGTRIVPEMAPLGRERILDKAGFNAFQCAPMDELLKAQKISHLLLMGVTTQVCISSTLRGAVDSGYFPLLLADCCAAFRQEDHEASISVIFSENHQFGWVSDSTRFLSAAQGVL